MKQRTLSAALLTGLLMAACSTLGAAVDRDAEPKPPVVPTDTRQADGVKTYLLAVIASSRTASADLKTDGTDYAELCQAHGGPAAAAAAEPDKMVTVIKRMRNDYKRIDSYGYEYMEGIVAGIPSLIKYDVELDSGVPTKGAGVQDAIADITITAGDTVIDHQGSLNNFLIEPTVYGTNNLFVAATAKLPGFEKPVGLPKPAVVLALADYSIDAYGRLDVDAHAWIPTDRSLFQAMANMTPTLADYFDEWKESKKYGQATGGRFVAVSRVSDMRGIMASTQLNWLSMQSKVAEKNPELAKTITGGYEQVMKFIDTIDARDQKKPLRIETIDALGAQAKERADKLTVQVSEAAALLGLNVNAK